MKVIFDERFLQTYTSDPAAARGRLDHAYDLVKEKFSPVVPAPCSDEDLLLVHTSYHVAYVRRDEYVYPMAVLAAGATIAAAESALQGEAAFALCRPPGHHASPDSCWGFCYFNNIAIAVRRVLSRQEAERAVIIDFDLHYGDGTAAAFAGDRAVDYYHVKGNSGRVFLENLSGYLQGARGDIVAVSAGFDRHAEDWGGLLTTADYKEMGKIIGSFAGEQCEGRVFAALEGGYNARSLGEALVAFLEGLEKGLNKGGQP